MTSLVKMTTAALATYNSLDRAVDFEGLSDGKTFRMLYNAKTQAFAVSLYSTVVKIDNKYAQVNKIGDPTGQCVGFVKALSGVALPTSSWIRGSQLTPTFSIAKGTAIATFTGANGTYGNDADSHTGFFLAFYTELATGKKGIEVFDQNWVAGASSGIGGIHRIPFDSSASSPKGDAGRYYIFSA